MPPGLLFIDLVLVLVLVLRLLIQFSSFLRLLMLVYGLIDHWTFNREVKGSNLCSVHVSNNRQGIHLQLSLSPLISNKYSQDFNGLSIDRF